jgi:hypothetical protein
MQKRFTIFLLCFTAKAFAQIPEDAVRYSWFPQNGTARTLAIGGAMGSLGGDLTANFVNPAGIGFYRTNEASITPSFFLNKVKTNYRGTDLNENKNAFSFGTSGFAFALPNRYSENKSNAFSIAITQNANFNNIVHYKGLNNKSSYSELFAEEFLATKDSINGVLRSNSSVPYTAAPALYTYLIDEVRVSPTSTIIKGAPEYILDAGQALQQEITKTTKGGLYELGLTYAGNDGEKWLWGIAIGIPIVNYQSNTLVKENDTSSNTNNHFKSFTYNDNFTTKGAGINGKFGLIYRPKEYVRIGLAIHTPSYMSLTDSRQSTLKTQLENPIGSFSVSSDSFTNGERGKAKYIQTSPWKFILSGSYVFREVEDVTKQRGFITADVEYVKHSGTKFSSDADQPTEDDKVYYKQLNGVIKDIYKGNINVRVGGEIKFNTIMGRLGFGYYGNPYKDAPSKANKMTLSGGLGYRNKGFFVDLTYVHLITKDFDVPYRLNKLETVYADVKQNRGNVIATIGVKF